MSFKGEYPVESLINENEDCVFRTIENVLASGVDICRCKDCMLDVAAIALNNLKPYYRVFLVRPVHCDSEFIEARLRKVEEEVRKAIEIVRLRPHHNKTSRP